MINTENLLFYDLQDPEYISEQTLNYFKRMLVEMHQEILKKEEAISLSMVDAPSREPDLVDQGTNEELHAENFAFQELEDQLRHEIEAALERVDNGTYGYCEETGEPIGVKRLLAVPYARYCLKAQTYKEGERSKSLGPKFITFS